MSNNMQCRCKNCGIELKPDHTGVCPHCGGTGKALVVTIEETVRVVAAVDIKRVRQELPKEERKLWERIVKSIRENVVVDGFEIGFPSGIKVIFRVRNRD
jgi:uncharacterized Zn finger protein (UPF0148 family)